MTTELDKNQGTKTGEARRIALAVSPADIRPGLVVTSPNHVARTPILLSALSLLAFESQGYLNVKTDIPQLSFEQVHDFSKKEENVNHPAALIYKAYIDAGRIIDDIFVTQALAIVHQARALTTSTQTGDFKEIMRLSMTKGLLEKINETPEKVTSVITKVLGKGSSAAVVQTHDFDVHGVPIPESIGYYRINAQNVDTYGTILVKPEDVLTHDLVINEFLRGVDMPPEIVGTLSRPDFLIRNVTIDTDKGLFTTTSGQIALSEGVEFIEGWEPTFAELMYTADAIFEAIATLHDYGFVNLDPGDIHINIKQLADARANVAHASRFDAFKILDTHDLLFFNRKKGTTRLPPAAKERIIVGKPGLLNPIMYVPQDKSFYEYLIAENHVFMSMLFNKMIKSARNNEQIASPTPIEPGDIAQVFFIDPGTEGNYPLYPEDKFVQEFKYADEVPELKIRALHRIFKRFFNSYHVHLMRHLEGQQIPEEPISLRQWFNDIKKELAA